jgi:hypothetical protein
VGWSLSLALQDHRQAALAAATRPACNRVHDGACIWDSDL